MHKPTVLAKSAVEGKPKRCVLRCPEADGHERQVMAEWSRPAFADERPVSTRLPTFRFRPRRRQTAVTLNRSQRSSTCRALSFSARSLRSPLRSKIAYANPLFICRDT